MLIDGQQKQQGRRNLWGREESWHIIDVGCQEEKFSQDIFRRGRGHDKQEEGGEDDIARKSITRMKRTRGRRKREKTWQGRGRRWYSKEVNDKNAPQEEDSLVWRWRGTVDCYFLTINTKYYYCGYASGVVSLCQLSRTHMYLSVSVNMWVGQLQPSTHNYGNMLSNQLVTSSQVTKSLSKKSGISQALIVCEMLVIFFDLDPSTHFDWNREV